MGKDEDEDGRCVHCGQEFCCDGYHHSEDCPFYIGDIDGTT